VIYLSDLNDLIVSVISVISMILADLSVSVIYLSDLNDLIVSVSSVITMISAQKYQYTPDFIDPPLAHALASSLINENSSKKSAKYHHQFIIGLKSCLFPF